MIDNMYQGRWGNLAFLISNKKLRCAIVLYAIGKQILETSNYIKKYLPTM